jgi:hypothetical protein
MSPTYPVGDQTVECHRCLGDRPQVGEGEGESISEPLATELVDPENTPIEPHVVEGDTDAGEKGGALDGTTCDPVLEYRFRPVIELFVFVVVSMEGSRDWLRASCRFLILETFNIRIFSL